MFAEAFQEIFKKNFEAARVYDPKTAHKIIYIVNELEQNEFDHLVKTASETKGQFLLVIDSIKKSLGKKSAKKLKNLAKQFKVNYLIIQTGAVADYQSTAQAIVNLTLTPKADSKPIAKTGACWAKVTTGVAVTICIVCLPLFLIWIGLKCAGWKWSLSNWPVASKCAQMSGQVAETFLPIGRATSPQLFDWLKEASLRGRWVRQLSHLDKLFLPAVSSVVGINFKSTDVNWEEMSILVGQLEYTLAQMSLAYDKNQTLPEAGRILNKFAHILPALPKLLSKDGDYRWLILVGDNAEIRASGGLIDSLIVFRLLGGRISDIQFISSNEADALLVGQVEPPTELAQVLGEDNWYMRDIGWEADFSEVAGKAAWLAEKELGVKIDGVAAINFSTLVKMLEIFGPVNIDAYGGLLNENNLWEKYRANVRFDQPKDSFSKKLSQELYEQIKTASPDKLRRMVLAIMSGLQSRDILVWPPEPAGRQEFSRAGWSGEVDIPGCASPYPCLNQFVYLVDSSVGLNKSGLDMQRELVVEVKIDSHQVSSRYVWRYVHMGENENWPGGIFRNFVRVYYSPQMKPVKIVLSGKDQSDLVLSGGNEGKIALEWPVMIGEEKTLEIEFKSPAWNTGRWHSQFSFLNQPGVEAYPLNLIVRYPSNWLAGLAEPATIAQKGSIRYNRQGGRPFIFNIDWLPGN